MGLNFRGAGQMERREFLKVAGTTGLVAALHGTSAADEAAVGKAAAKVRRVETDRFVLEFAPTAPRPLRILQLTDTHFGTFDPKHRAGDKRSFEEIRRLVEQQRVDFVVHTGDFINNDSSPLASF